MTVGEPGIMADRCVHCQRLMYWHAIRQVWVHYIGDTEWCFPNLAHLDAFSQVAEPGPGEVNEG